MGGRLAAGHAASVGAAGRAAAWMAAGAALFGPRRDPEPATAQRLVQLLSPGAAALTREAWAFTDGEAGTMALSLDPDATWRMALKLLALALFFLVVYNTYRTHAQVRRAIWVMIGMGTLIALFGIAQRMTWNGRFYWVGPEAPHGSAFGPFVNRTHFAGLMVVIVPMALALALAGRRDPERHRHSRDWRARLRAWNSREAGPASLIPWLVFLMGGAALVSGSRGGLLALLAALLLMVGLAPAVVAAGGAPGESLLATVLIVLTGIWIGGDILYGTVERLAEEISQPEESPRLHIWADALHLWRQFPAFGTGLGTFGVVFPLVRTLPAPVTFTHAESDWVQLLIDTGAVGSAPRPAKRRDGGARAPAPLPGCRQPLDARARPGGPGRPGWRSGARHRQLQSSCDVEFRLSGAGGGAFPCGLQAWLG